MNNQSHSGFRIGVCFGVLASLSFIIAVYSIFNPSGFNWLGLICWKTGNSLALCGIFALQFVIYFNKSQLDFLIGRGKNYSDINKCNFFRSCAIVLFVLALLAYTGFVITNHLLAGIFIPINGFLFIHIGNIFAVFSNLSFSFAIYYKTKILNNVCEHICSMQGKEHT